MTVDELNALLEGRYRVSIGEKGYTVAILDPEDGCTRAEYVNVTRLSLSPAPDGKTFLNMAWFGG